MESDAAQLSFRAPARRAQRRWTLVLRPLLVAPIVVEALVLSCVVAVMVPVVWVLALRDGTNAASGFFARYLRYVTRVSAYATLLSDQYPGFSLQPRALYPIEVATATARQGRLALLARIVLAPLALFVTVVNQLGRAVVLVLTWPWTIATGQLPLALYEAVCVTERFYLRSLAYTLLLQSEYPRDLFGERVLIADSLTLLEALATSPITSDSDMRRRALAATDPGVNSPVRVARRGRRVVALTLVLGIISCGVLRHEYQVANAPSQVVQQWSDRYYLSVRNTIDDAQTALANVTTLAQSPHDQLSVANAVMACESLGGDLWHVEHEPRYPTRGPRRTLHNALVQLSTFQLRCITQADAPRLAMSVAELSSEYETALRTTIVFLDEIPQPGDGSSSS